MCLMDGDFFEDLAIMLHELAGMDPSQLNCPMALARALDITVLEAGDEPIPGGGYAWADWGDPRIYLRPWLSRARLRFAAAHEIAELMLSGIGIASEDREATADRFGAAILLPRPAVRRVLTNAPWEGLRDFASRLGVDQTTAALRFGEVTGDPIAVVTRKHTRVRGDLERWPEPPRRLARARRLPTGTFRLQIGAGRVVVGVA